MRTCRGLFLACLMLGIAIAGCSPKELSPEELEAAAVGVWSRNPTAPALELNADKTLKAPFDTTTRTGTWSMNLESREIVLNVDRSEPDGNGSSWDAAIWTAYISKDGATLKFYTMESSSIAYVTEQTGKDPGTVLYKR